MTKAKVLSGKYVRTPTIYDDYRDIAQCWMLQILIKLGVHSVLFYGHRCMDGDVLFELGLGHLLEMDEFNGNEAKAALQKQYDDLSASPLPVIPSKTQLAKNIAWIAKKVGLNETEQDILHFRVIVSRHLALKTCIDNIANGLDLLMTSHVLGRLLGHNAADVERALNSGGRLIRTGLIYFSSDMEDFTKKMTLLPGFADNLFVKHENLYSLFENNFSQAAPSRLTAADYSHLVEDIALLKNYLTDALEIKRKGVNVLIYGTPGSGKTEFVKMLSEEIGHPLFEVVSENAAGGPVCRANRFRSFRLSQHILDCNQAKPLILFDEIEDVFKVSDGDDEETNHGKTIGMKAWINKLLEGNQIPSFWLSNNLRCLDKAFIRRFDYVIEMNTPPRSVRSKILDQYLGGIEVSSSWKANMAEHEYLNPAVIERAAKVIEIAKQRMPEIQPEKALERTLGNTLEAMGLPRSPRHSVSNVTHYRLDILNTDCNIKELSEGLRLHGEGRLCLYGPPGTGKSAFGKYLAEALDRPLILRRASDILSPYLGLTERNMADMFIEAAQENAVLLLDEADSFLRDRNGATRNWEVSEVNEMLTQMESFNGIFIAATNLMSTLDAAALRRFDMKVKFDYLKPEQAWQMFQDFTTKHQLVATEENRAQLCKEHLLTPGDFANVERQSRLSSIKSAQNLIEKLKAECRVKPEGTKQAIGF